MDIESDSPAPSQHTRRDLIKRSAAAGVAVWAAPAILSVSRAAAASPVIPPGCCGCNNDATALRIAGSGLLNPIDIEVSGDPCVASVDVGVLDASVLCSATGCAAAACFANASVANVSVGGVGGSPGILSTTDIVSSASAPCGCGAPPSGTTTIASLTVLGTNIVLPAVIPPNFIVGPVVVPLGLGSVTATVTLNEQECLPNGQFRVRAIHIVVSETVPVVNFGAEIVISESIAKAAGCNCV